MAKAATITNKKPQSIKQYVKHNGARIASIATISLLLFGFILGMVAPVLTELSHDHGTEEIVVSTDELTHDHD